ncbi:hypothetical protein GCM10009574_093010 [Streptomyces asiaticus]|uniref:Secreted protein n=2 Tax=Streptomyces rhizosphaericus TaxID=114699 RepID=A0ABP4D3R1_9ACTN
MDPWSVLFGAAWWAHSFRTSTWVPSSLGMSAVCLPSLPRIRASGGRREAGGDGEREHNPAVSDRAAKEWQVTYSTNGTCGVKCATHAGPCGGSAYEVRTRPGE